MQVLSGVSKASHPLLFSALKTSGGRLGVVLDVKIAIEKQRTVEVQHQVHTEFVILIVIIDVYIDIDL